MFNGANKIDNSDEDSDSDLEIVLNNDVEDMPKDAAPKEQPKALVGLPIPKIDSSAVVTTTVKAGLDINVIGQHDGVDIIDVDLDSFEDKPWRKPGADLTDYFNFGFNEQTWKAYCDKQKMFRDDLKRSQAVESGKDFEYDIKALQDMTGGKYQKGGPQIHESRRGQQQSNKRSRPDDDYNDSFDQYDVTQKRPARPGSSESIRRDRSPRREYSRERSRERSPPRSRRDYDPPPRRDRSPPRGNDKRGSRRR